MLPLKPLPRTLAAALRDVEHSKLAVRQAAVRDLARLAEGTERPQALSALVKALAKDQAPEVRAAAAVALADAGAGECLKEILRATCDGDLYVRQMALVALGEIAEPGDADALSAVRIALNAAAPPIRFQALVALHRLAEEDVEEAIIDHLQDADAEIRYVALRIAEERWASAEEPARGKAPEAICAKARAALDDSSPAVRLAAGILLARLGESSGAEAVARALNDSRALREAEDEQAAIELAGELGLESAQPGLRRRAWGGLLRQSPFAWEARIALARLGDRRAQKTILRGLEAWTRDARTLAVAAAGRARLSEAREAISAMQGDDARADPHAVAEALRALDAG